MLAVKHVISRIRTTLRQQSAGTVSTRTNVKWSSETKFSDEDLRIRISNAEFDIMSLADAGFFQASIKARNGTFTLAPYMRLLENRVFRQNFLFLPVPPGAFQIPPLPIGLIRCVRQPAQTQRSLSGRREPHALYPTYTYSGGVLKFFPEPGVPEFTGFFVGTKFSYFVLEPPVKITSGSTNLTVREQFEEAVVQHVCSTCRMSMSIERIEVELNNGLATWHDSQFVTEMMPYLRATKLTRFDDSEVVVEREVN